MKIAIVTETFLPSIDGIVTRLTATIKWLSGQGHEVLVVAPDLGPVDFDYARIVGVPVRTFFLYPSRKFAVPTRRVEDILRQFQPDLVHVVNPAFLGIAGIYYGRKLRLPLVASYHTNFPQYADYYKLPFLKPVLWAYARTLHNRAQLNLCTSQTVKRELESRGFKRVQVWKRGVDAARFGPRYADAALRNRLSGGRPEKKLLLYVGRLAPEKEIEKIRDVLAASPDFCLAVVGDGPHRARLEAHFEGTQTVFTGFLQGEELSAAYASSDIFVFPSTTETLGLVLMEAMASGLPVVAAMSGPTAEQIEDGRTGLLYDPEDSGSFVGKVMELKDGERRSFIAAGAREASASLGWSEPSAQLLRFYEQLAVRPVGVEVTG